MDLFGRGLSARLTRDAEAHTTSPATRRSPLLDEPQEQAVLDGRYRIGPTLGRGGEASVHLARDLVLHRDVAVKLFHQEQGSSGDRLQRLEARVLAALNHYALTTLLDAGAARGPGGSRRLYLVMEYVEGESLRDRLRRGPMEVSEACWLGFDLAEGLESMHQAGFLHRDVKPSNILISRQRSVRPVVAKLTDFGITARVGEPDLSEFTVGTAAYLSPEQVEGHDAQTGSDTYSLALVLLEAMTGEVEFTGTIEQAAFARLTRDPRIPPTLPPRLAAVLRGMTARDPARRMDLHTVAVELQQVLVDDLVRRRGFESGVVAPPQPEAASGAQSSVVRVAPGQFDRVLHLVALVLGVPRALVVLQEEDRSSPVAQHGWGEVPAADLVEPLLAAEGGEGEAFQAAADDALPGRLGPLRAAMGAPVRDAAGRALGWLLCFDEQPRRFTDVEAAALAGFAGLVAQDVEFRAAVRRALFPAD